MHESARDTSKVAIIDYTRKSHNALSIGTNSMTFNDHISLSSNFLGISSDFADLGGNKATLVLPATEFETTKCTFQRFRLRWCCRRSSARGLQSHYGGGENGDFQYAKISRHTAMVTINRQYRKSHVVDFSLRAIRTCTAVALARLPLRQLGFLVWPFTLTSFTCQHFNYLVFDVD